MRKIVINKDYGGFSVSKKVIERMEASGHTGVLHLIKWHLTQIGHRPKDGYHIDQFISRSDPALVAAVEALGAEANGQSSSLKVVELDDNEHVQLDEYDGKESVKRIHCDCCEPIEKRS